MHVLALLAAIAAPPGLLEAYDALRDKRFDQAISTFSQTVQAHPETLPKAWGWGMALYGKGDLTGALEFFERVLAVDPKHPRALYGRGLVTLRTGGNPEADLRAALTVEPDGIRARFRLGQALAARGAYDEATIELRGVLQRRWIHQSARHSLILALRDAGKRDEALQVIAEFARVEPLVDRIRAAERGVRKRPDDFGLRKRIRELYEQAGRTF